MTDKLLAVARAATHLVEETCEDDWTVCKSDWMRLCDALDALGFDPCIEDGP